MSPRFRPPIAPPRGNARETPVSYGSGLGDAWEVAHVGSKRELTELLAEVKLFSRCTTHQRRTIARHCQIAELPAGVELIAEGEAGDALFLIIEGKAVVSRDSVELNRVGPGAYFGELAILDGEPRSATVVAESDVKVAVIGIRMFRTLLREFSDLAEQLLIALAGELREARTAR
jgi:CRP/FNR family transcriptional regulator, cyclic AMP receptor protein